MRADTGDFNVMPHQGRWAVTGGPAVAVGSRLVPAVIHTYDTEDEAQADARKFYEGERLQMRLCEEDDERND